MSAKYAFLGFIENAYPGRTEEVNFGTYYSVILLGKCSFRCAYCDVGGFDRTDDDILPNVRRATITEMKAFAEEQARLARPIVISGGDPTLFPEVSVELAKTIKAQGGYSILCTNGSNVELTTELSSHFDEVGISVKGARGTVERMTGRSIQDAWDNPIETINRISAQDKPVEVTLMVFDFTKASDFDEVIQKCNSSCYLIVKDYKAKTIAVNDDSYKTVTKKDTSWFAPPSEEQLYAILGQIKAKYPQFKGRIRLVMGDHGKNWIVTDTRKYYFERPK